MKKHPNKREPHPRCKEVTCSPSSRWFSWQLHCFSSFVESTCTLTAKGPHAIHCAVMGDSPLIRGKHSALQPHWRPRIFHLFPFLSHAHCRHFVFYHGDPYWLISFSVPVFPVLNLREQLADFHMISWMVLNEQINIFYCLGFLWGPLICVEIRFINYCKHLNWCQCGC